MANRKIKKVRTPIAKVVYNPPATIIFWKDGDKTVAKCGPNDVFDKEKGFLVASVKHYMKYAYRSHTSDIFRNDMALWCPSVDAPVLETASLKTGVMHIPTVPASKAKVGIDVTGIVN